MCWIDLRERVDSFITLKITMTTILFYTHLKIDGLIIYELSNEISKMIVQKVWSNAAWKESSI